MTPKVSVLTPIYNTDHSSLREMIESVLSQTFTDFEFLILNDSPDNKELERIVKSYNDSRIIYNECEKNLGISGARNKLIDLSRGEYLAICDHDDISLNYRFEKQVNYLDANPDIGVVGGQMEWFPGLLLRPYLEKNLEIKKKMITACEIPHPASMIRKSALGTIRYEEKYSPAEDYMLWARLMEQTQFHNLSDVILKYRDDGNNTSYKQRNRMENADAMVKNYILSTYPYFSLEFIYENIKPALKKDLKKIKIIRILHNLLKNKK